MKILPFILIAFGLLAYSKELVAQTEPVLTILQTGTISYRTPVAGKPGFVKSPYAPFSGSIDLRGCPPNIEVKRPLFRPMIGARATGSSRGRVTNRDR